MCVWMSRSANDRFVGKLRIRVSNGVEIRSKRIALRRALWEVRMSNVGCGEGVQDLDFGELDDTFWIMIEYCG